MGDVVKNQLTQICHMLQSAAQKARVLTHPGGYDGVRDEFLANNAKSLPVGSYADYNAQPVLDLVAQARRLIKTAQLDHGLGISDWLDRRAMPIENSARMLVACGTVEIFTYSSALYGAPGDVLIDQTSTALTLTGDFSAALSQLDRFNEKYLLQTDVDSSELAANLGMAAQKMFGDDAPVVTVVDELSANALAGRERIAVRRDTKFNDKDIDQLIHHGAGLPVATSLNGKYQAALPILSTIHAGTTRTQEGLADRTLVNQMAVDEADFIEIYHYFMERTGSRLQVFFIVYLDGLIRVHNFLRVLVAYGRADCMLLFCGKLDLEDIPVHGQLSQIGMCIAPRYLPAWASNMRFLLSYLAYSGFLNTINVAQVSNHYESLLQSAPLVEMGG